MRQAVSKERAAPQRLAHWARGALLSVLVLLFVAGYAARYISPDRIWWIQLVAVLLPYMSVLVFLAALVMVVRRPRRWPLLALVAVLLLARFYPARLLNTGSDSATRITVMTYNVPAQRTGPEEANALVDVLSGVDPDILMLQEARWRYNDARARGRLDVRTLVAETSLAIAEPDSGEHFFSRVPVLAKMKAINVREWNYKYDPEQPDPLELFRTEFDWDGRRMALYNFHLASYGENKLWEETDRSRIDPRVWAEYLRRYRSAIRRRAWEAIQVRRHLDEEALPFIIAGDFNATPHNWTFRTISRGLTDAFQRAGTGTGMTYHRKRPLARIDFILLSKELDAVSARTVDGGLSDHRGVIASVRWK